MKERILWIDYAKGYAIIIMVIAHYINTPIAIEKWIYTFHMPLFFFLSGYLTSSFPVQNKCIYIYKRFKALMIPYITFGFIMMGVELLVKPEYALNTSILNILYYVAKPATWFFFMLFLLDCIYLFIRKFNPPIKIVITFFLFFIGYYWMHKEVSLPFRLQIVPNILVFFLLGDLLYGKLNTVIEKLSLQRLWMIAIIMYVLSICASILFLRIDLYLNSLNPYYVPNAMFGIIGTSILCFILDKYKGLVYLKRSFKYCTINAILILVFHSKIFWIAEILFGKCSFPILSNTIIQSIIVLILEILILYPLILIVNRYFYFLLGKKERIVVHY
jgi:fucose 4-O-acetylase-like acetyltransferase